MRRSPDLTEAPAPRRPACPTPRLSCAVRYLLADKSGAALVEAAFVLPILIMLLMGIVSYAQYFMIAHTVQQAANEAARAAVTGIDEADRKLMIKSSVDASIAGSGSVDRAFVTTSTVRNGDYYTVAVSYDISRNPSLQSTSIIPLPAGQIRRQSTVKLVLF